jgi:urease subunit beta
VRLIELAGRREVFGLSNAVNGKLDGGTRQEGDVQ